MKASDILGYTHRARHDQDLIKEFIGRQTYKGRESHSGAVPEVESLERFERNKPFNVQADQYVCHADRATINFPL